MSRWQPKSKPTARQRQATRRTYNLANCQRGKHLLIPTFRPGEQVCTSCGVVLYCPECLRVHQLPVSSAHRAYPLACSTHVHAEVQV
ncbi:MAG TPA: hypothetical protein VEL31_02720 [Ktedonobacteraceae bacterium]|nr:hypothetical protein [Ktedonobacteraceae bacterium]